MPVAAFSPRPVLQMRASVLRGDLGKIIHVPGHFFLVWLLIDTDYNWRLLASEGGKLRAVGDIGTHWVDAVSFILGDRVESVFATLETFHKTRKRPRGEVKTFAKVDPKKMVRYQVDTEDFGNVLLRFANGVQANAAISQVAAGWKCSLAIGIYGTEASMRWDLEHPNEILVGLRGETQPGAAKKRRGFFRRRSPFHRLSRRASRRVSGQPQDEFSRDLRAYRQWPENTDPVRDRGRWTPRGAGLRRGAEECVKAGVGRRGPGGYMPGGTRF